MSALLAAALAGEGLQLFGGLRQAKMAKAIGAMRQRLANQSATETIASGQRTALEQKRQADLLASRAIAVASAGGANTSDPTISKIVADIHGEGAYRAAIAMYEAESSAAKQQYEGNIAKIGGDISSRNKQISTIGTALSNGASIYAGYKKGIYG